MLQVDYKVRNCSYSLQNIDEIWNYKLKCKFINNEWKNKTYESEGRGESDSATYKMQLLRYLPFYCLNTCFFNTCCFYFKNTCRVNIKIIAILLLKYLNTYGDIYKDVLFYF